MDDTNATTQPCNSTFVWTLFEHCPDDPDTNFYTNFKFWSNFTGMLSIFIWLFPALPQMYKNYRHKSCNGLSIYFLLCLFVGDLLNLSGSILSNQLPVQIYVAFYFIGTDVILLIQHVYYNGGSVCRRPESFQSSKTSSRLPAATNQYKTVLITLIAVLVHQSQASSENQDLQLLPTKQEKLGYTFGILSAFLYIGSRVPQIHKNHVNKSTGDSSCSMFALLICGEMSYFASVVLHDVTWYHALKHLPWIAACVICSLMDVVVIVQHVIYDKRKTREDHQDAVVDEMSLEQQIRHSLLCDDEKN